MLILKFGLIKEFKDIKEYVDKETIDDTIKDLEKLTNTKIFFLSQEIK